MCEELIKTVAWLITEHPKAFLPYHVSIPDKRITKSVEKVTKFAVFHQPGFKTAF